PVALPGSPRSRPSFPTRRSSDLHCFRPRVLPAKGDQRLAWRADEVDGCEPRAVGIEGEARLERVHRRAAGKVYGYEPPAPLPPRSEEHTSELQSLTNLVCRLLLD